MVGRRPPRGLLAGDLLFRAGLALRPVARFNGRGGEDGSLVEPTADSCGAILLSPFDSPLWEERFFGSFSGRCFLDTIGACSRNLWLISGQTSCHRPLQTTVRRATMGFTCSLAQCIPKPLSRASTTSLLALSTAPLPMGRPLARNSAYLICPLGFSRYSRLPLIVLTAPSSPLAPLGSIFRHRSRRLRSTTFGSPCFNWCNWTPNHSLASAVPAPKAA